MNEQRLLKCELTRKELAAYVVELTDRTLEEEGVEREKKEAMAVYAGKLKTIATRRLDLATALERGAEYRHVDCVGQLNEDGTLWEVTRTDTGEIVESRPPQGAEKQTRLEV
jgi:hypothetical protein